MAHKLQALDKGQARAILSRVFGGRMKQATSNTGCVCVCVCTFVKSVLPHTVLLHRANSQVLTGMWKGFTTGKHDFASRLLLPSHEIKPWTDRSQEQLLPWMDSPESLSQSTKQRSKRDPDISGSRQPNSAGRKRSRVGFLLTTLGPGLQPGLITCATETLLSQGRCLLHAWQHRPEPERYKAASEARSVLSQMNHRTLPGEARACT